MDSPCHPPSSPAAPDAGLTGKRRFWKLMIRVSVIGMLLPPLAGISGIAGTALDVIRAFRELSEQGRADPGALAGMISASLLSPLYGLLLSIPGLVVLIFSIRRYRACRALTSP